MKAINQLLEFFHLCERLKMEKRNGKTSDNEHDRVASHSWRMAMMIVLLEPFLEKEIDLTRAMKMSLIHDLAEIITGDQAYFHHEYNKAAKEQKKLAEEKAMMQLIDHLPLLNKNELFQLWNEYENQSSYEAKLVKAIDKIEAQIQHNEADISVWNEFDKKHYMTFLNQYCDFDKVLKQLRIAIQQESLHKLESSENA